MFIKTEINDFNEVAKMAWSGAVQVCQEIINQDREAEAMCLIEEIFYEATPSSTELNDFIWFELGDLMHLWEDEEDTEEDDEEEEE